MKLIAALVVALAIPACAQFEILDGKTTASLRGIDAVNPQVAWASGSGGTVLLTTDGGVSWKHCAVPTGGEKLDFRGVQGFDATIALIMASGKGPLSAIYKTTDGCATWKLVFANPDAEGFFDALRFDHDGRMRGILLGDPVNGSFVLFQTLDGGTHWTRAISKDLAAASPGIGAFAASNTALDESGGTFGSGGPDGPYIYSLTISCTAMAAEDVPDRCFRETLGGEHEKVAMAGSTGSQGVFSISGMVAVGGDYSKPNAIEGTAVYHFHDLWIAAETMPHGYRSAVAYDKASDTYMAVGPNGTDISTDGGKNWSPVGSSAKDSPDADKNWNAISLPFVVGSKGKIGKLEPGVLGK